MVRQWSLLSFYWAEGNVAPLWITWNWNGTFCTWKNSGHDKSCRTWKIHHYFAKRKATETSTMFFFYNCRLRQLGIRTMQETANHRSCEVSFSVTVTVWTNSGQKFTYQHFLPNILGQAEALKFQPAGFQTRLSKICCRSNVLNLLEDENRNQLWHQHWASVFRANDKLVVNVLFCPGKENVHEFQLWRTQKLAGLQVSEGSRMKPPKGY